MLMITIYGCYKYQNRSPREAVKFVLFATWKSHSVCITPYESISAWIGFLAQHWAMRRGYIISNSPCLWSLWSCLQMYMSPTYWKLGNVAEFYRTVAEFYLFLNFKCMVSLPLSYSAIFVGQMNDNIYVCVFKLDTRNRCYRYYGFTLKCALYFYKLIGIFFISSLFLNTVFVIIVKKKKSFLITSVLNQHLSEINRLGM